MKQYSKSAALSFTIFDMENYAALGDPIETCFSDYDLGN